MGPHDLQFSGQALSLERPLETVDRYQDAICARASFFKTTAFWKPALPNPDDEAFAQLALEAKVGYLVTHNQRHFPADRLPALKVTLPKEFLHILQTAKP